MPSTHSKSKYDQIIMSFLDNASNIQKVTIGKPLSYLTSSIRRRIRIYDFGGIKCYEIDHVCYLEIDDLVLRSKYSQKLRNVLNGLETEASEYSKVLRKEKSDYHHKRNLVRKRKWMLDTIRKTVSVICLDFSESDREFLIREVYDKLTDNIIHGVSLTSQAASLIYLLSKCPKNSNMPLQLNEVYRRFKEIDPNSSVPVLNNNLSFFKNIGVQTCRVNPEMIIESKRGAFTQLVIDNKALQGEVDVMLGSAIKFSSDSAFRKLTMGKSPYVIAASLVCFYKKSSVHISKNKICKIFGVTAVSTRKIESILRGMSVVSSPSI